MQFKSLVLVAAAVTFVTSVSHAGLSKSSFETGAVSTFICTTADNQTVIIRATPDAEKKTVAIQFKSKTGGTQDGIVVFDEHNVVQTFATTDGGEGKRPSIILSIAAMSGLGTANIAGKISAVECVDAP